MNNRYTLYSITITLLLQSSFIATDTVVDTFKKTLAPNSEQLFVDIIQEKRNQLQKIVDEKETRLKTHEEFAAHLHESIEEINNLIEGIERSIAQHHDNQFKNKELVLYKEMYQVLKDLLRVDDDFLALLDTLETVLKQFIEDPDFNTFKKERQLNEQVYYSFEDLHSLYDIIVNQERLVAQLAEQEKNMQSEQDSRKRAVKNAEEEHTKNLEELQILTEKSSLDSKISTEQKDKELLSIEERLYRNKKELYDLRLKEIKYTIDLIQIRLFIERTHLDLLKQYLRTVKSLIRVNESDVINAKELLTTQKKEYFSRKEGYQLERDRLAAAQREKERRRDALSKEHGISLGRDLDEWGREPKQTVNSYMNLAELGVINSQVQWLQKERDFVETQRALEDEKFNYITILTNAKETYYKISSRKFDSEEEIAQEIKQYETQKTDEQSILAIDKERMNAVADSLNHQKKILDNITIWRERVTKQKDYIFNGKTSEYNKLLELLNRAEEYVKKQVDVLGKLTGAYSGIISEVNASIRLINFIIGELQSITIWYRPEYAITYQGVKNIPSDIVAFFSDIRTYIVRFDFSVSIARLKDLFKNFIHILYFLIKLLILCFVFYFFKKLAPSLKNILLNKTNELTGLTHIISFFLGALIIFIDTYLLGIFIWCLGALLFLVTLQDPYLSCFFYLFSIPYLTYLINRIMRFIETFNTLYNYMLLSQDFQKRFIFVCSTLLYATVSIFLFRHAFMSISYYKTELPTILLAINFIIFQIALIFLISKEQILSLIPKRNEAWLWIGNQVDRYFYLILFFVITIIVMSNPYVGFGRLVLYLLSSFIYTSFLVKGLLWIHGFVKRLASYTFFFSDEEVVRERFVHARTWFGLLIIASFFIFTFLGTIIAAKIWGWPISLKEVMAFLTKPLLLENTAYPVTMVSVLQIIGFVMLGFIAAYALNRFVLDKIFDLLLVDPGVQYTTIRFIQYSVVIIFVFFGFKNVGLGDLIGYILGALALGIGWYVREPIGDFVAYFIILVQRPLKIGDFVQIDTDTIGIVRKITPRAIVIRRKNSTTIVVPNSYIMSKSIVNWNYVRNFIAFNDILITIAYKEDPAKVKELLFTAVSSHPNVLRNPKPLIRLEEFGEYGYIFLIRGFISSAYTMDMWDIASDVRLTIVKLLKEQGIEIAELIRIVKDTNGKMNKISPGQREDMGNCKE